MKKYLINIILIILSFIYVLNAKENNTLTKSFYKPLVVTIITNNSLGDTLKDFFDYDEKGNLLTQTLVNVTNGGYLYLERKSSTYDENGNRLSYIEEKRNGIKWDTLNRTINTYTNFGRVETELYETFEWGYFARKGYYTYDDRYRLSQIKEDFWENDTWVNYYIYYYSYDIYSNLEYETSKYDVGYRVDYTRYYNVYDVDGNRVIRLQEAKVYGDTLFRAVQRYFYNYVNNKLTSIKLQNWYLNVWTNRAYDTLTYNAEGKLIEYLYKYWFSNRWEDNYRRQYTYDYQGNKITELFQDVISANFYNEDYNIYAYDQNNNCVNAKCNNWAGNHWTIGGGSAKILYNSGKDTLNYDASEVNVEYVFFTDINDEDISVNSFSLSQNYPNPFNPSTTINYQIPNESLVTIKVYDILGKEVTTLVNENKAAGKYSINFDAKNLASGVYLYRIKAGNYVSTKKMMLLR